MRVIETKSYAELSRKAANLISAQVLSKPDSVLGLATGSTPIGTYKQLIEWYEKGGNILLLHGASAAFWQWEWWPSPAGRLIWPLCLLRRYFYGRN